MPGETPPINGEITVRLARGDVDAAKELTGRFYERISRIASTIYPHRSCTQICTAGTTLGVSWVRRGSG